MIVCASGTAKVAISFSILSGCLVGSWVCMLPRVHAGKCTLEFSLISIIGIIPSLQISHLLIDSILLLVPSVPSSLVVIVVTWHFHQCFLCRPWLACFCLLWLSELVLLFSAVNYGLLQLLLGLRRLALHVPDLFLQSPYFCL